MKSNRVKVNLSLSEDVLSQLDEESNKLYMSRSGFVTMCVMQYISSQKVLHTMPEMVDAIQKASQLLAANEGKNEA